MATIWLIPFFPLLSATVLILSTGRMPRQLAALSGAGSVGLSALCVALLARGYLDTGEVRELTLWTWMAIENFTPKIAFYIDGLTIVMMSVITGVGFLIHLYSIEFMWEDESLCRYFVTGDGG
jgi:NADH-quinone oxidoreductase subunit L